jgi:hypothetical protein
MYIYAVFVSVFNVCQKVRFHLYINYVVIAPALYDDSQMIRIISSCKIQSHQRIWFTDVSRK